MKRIIVDNYYRNIFRFKVRGPETHPILGVRETELKKEGGYLVGFLWPAQKQELVEGLVGNTIVEGLRCST